MGVNFKVELGDNPRCHSVKGTALRVASDRDLRRFGLRGRNNTGAGGQFSWAAWEACRRKFGRYPDGLHFSNHPIFNEKEEDVVRVVSGAQSVLMLDYECNPTAYGSDILENPFEEPGTFTSHLNQIQSHAHIEGSADELSWGLAVTIGYEVGGDAAGYKVSTSATASIGGSHSEHESDEDTETIEKGVAVSVTLKPGQKARIIQMAAKGTMHVRVKFRNTLRGAAWVNYHQKTLNGSAWHRFPIDEFLKLRDGAMESADSFETYKVGFVSESRNILEPLTE